MTGSLRAYSRHRAERGLEGQSLAAIQKALSSGRIKKDKDGQIDFDKADASWSTKTAPSVTNRTARHRAVASAPVVERATVAAPRSIQGDAEGYTKARAMNEAIKAALGNLELKKKTGELVSAAEVELEWAAIISSARNRLLMVATKASSKVAANSDPRECQAIIETLLKEALSALSKDSN